MARYIDVDKLIELMKKEDALVEYEDIKEYAKENTEDVAPVVHGKWKMNSDYPDTLICSNCDSKYDVIWIDCGSNYCPHCGAKMEE